MYCFVYHVFSEYVFLQHKCPGPIIALFHVYLMWTAYVDWLLFVHVYIVLCYFVCLT